MGSCCLHYVVLIMAFLFTLHGGNALSFPSYDHSHHPIHNLSVEHKIQPVVMQKYQRYAMNDGWTTGRMLFAPASAAYKHAESGVLVGAKLDVLYVVGTSKRSKLPYVRLQLTRRARVLLLISAKGMQQWMFNNKSAVSGLSNDWKYLGRVRSVCEERIPVGDAKRLKGNVTLPAFGFVMERMVEAHEVLRLPHPACVSVGSKRAQRFTLLFAQPIVEEVKPFAYPVVPPKLLDQAAGKTISTTVVRANMRCPRWLHDLHVTASRDVRIAEQNGERQWWRTWHPAIDPVFWCYYDHEHGSYPGLYRPAFHYTAFKTADASTLHGRQQESHNGFKVFSFAIAKQRKFVVITVHMHVSRARRFTTRFHTVVFAVLNDEWELQAEVSMKMDFGAAVVTRADQTEEAVSAADVKVMAELAEKHVLARRRFNLLNIDERYPASVDGRYLLHNFLSANGGNKKLLVKGIYEQWRGPLNSCMQGGGTKLNRGFNFDVRNPSTAMRTVNATTDASMQRLAGDNVNRFLKLVEPVRFGVELCQLGGDGADKAVREGTFFTDAYFTRVEAGAGRHAVRQYIDPNLGTVELGRGLILPVGPWWQPMEYVPPGTERVDGRRLESIENSVLAAVN